MIRNIQDILSDYWNCVYQQGLDRREHDDENGTAQKLEDELQEFVRSAGKERADGYREGWWPQRG